MFINGVKVTFTICLTIIVCCILCISYSEYTNRYTIVPTSDNSVYIFDKKSTFLNKCDNNGCKLIETKMPAVGGNGAANQIMQTTSKMFGEDKPMTEEITKAEATPKTEKQTEEENPKEKKAKQEPINDNKSQENNNNEQNNKQETNKPMQSTNKPITIKQ